MVCALATERKLNRQTLKPIPLTQDIIKRVNEIGFKEGMTNLKFDAKHKEILWDPCLIAGVDCVPDDSLLEDAQDPDCDFKPEDDVDLECDTDEDLPAPATATPQEPNPAEIPVPITRSKTGNDASNHPWFPGVEPIEDIDPDATLDD